MRKMRVGAQKSKEVPVMIRNPVAEALVSNIPSSQPTQTEPQKAEPTQEVNTPKTSSASQEADAAKGREDRATTTYETAKKSHEQASSREKTAEAEAKQAAQKEASARGKMKDAARDADLAKAEADQAARANDLKVTGRAVNIFA